MPALLESWRALAEAEDVTLFLTPVNLAEVWRGARPSEYSSLAELTEAFRVLALDREIGERAGALLRQFAGSHGLHLADALIAATALVHDLELWTRNRKHYPMPGLRFYSA